MKEGTQDLGRSIYFLRPKHDLALGKKLVEKEKLKTEKRITIVEQVSWGEGSAVSEATVERLNLNKRQGCG